MTARTYSVIMRVVVVALAAFVAVSVVVEMPFHFALAGVMVALVAAIIVRRFVREIMADERNRRIEEKAASVSYRVYTVVTASIALIVMLLRSSLPEWAGIAARTMAFSVCGLMLLHLAVTRYYGTRL